jgi:sulfate adenylyltransferase subunit 2
MSNAQLALQQAQPSADFEAKLARSRALLQQAAHEFQPLVQASSLGAEDVVIRHLIETLDLPIPMLVLDTGALHPETLELLARTEARAEQHGAAPVQIYRPQAGAAEAFVEREGTDAMRRSVALRQACCAIRKVEPLRRALHGQRGWITGLRREQSATRADVPLIDRSDLDPARADRPSAGLLQFNPLADWSWGDVWHHIARHGLDYNPLHDRFYPSIGCAPCTRAVSVGEDFRAGRWWWEQDGAKECGLHSAKECGSHSAPPRLDNSQLDALEEETIFILREVAAAFERPALLFSGGKDSLVLLRCAEKAFGRGRLPYPLLMIDTGHNFPEVLAFRDQRAHELGAELIVRRVEDSMARGSVRLANPGQSRNAHQSVTLLEAIDEFRFDALIGGARRDEEKARAKERLFSHRDAFGQWQPKAQRPELWNLYNTRLQPGEHFRVFPISNWTEIDVWQYIERERIALPSLYYAHLRQVVQRRGLLVPVTELTPPLPGEQVLECSVRFRTVGDITCTCPVASTAATAGQIVAETLNAQLSERGATRMDDQTSEASMEKRKLEGYF